MAIYAVDNENLFANLFDITIQIKAMFKLINEKNKFNQLYLHANKSFDYTIINKNDNAYVEEIKEIIDSYFC